MANELLQTPDPPPALARVLEEGGAVAWSEPVTIMTYRPADPDPYPMFFDRRVYQGSSGRVYPLPFIDSIAADSAPRRWQAIHLENRWIRLMVLPELGGRIHVGYDKTAGYDFFYRNNVIKPALVGLGGPWIAGGVEFNWPQHHRPATFLPVETAIEEHPDGSVTVWCSDHDPFTRMKGMHGIRLHPDRAVVEVVVRLHNRTSVPQTFLWWANAAARVHDGYQSFFPTDVRYVADHARRAITAFPVADRPYYAVDYPAREHPDTRRLDFYRNIPVPTSYMVTDTVDDFFGGYDHHAEAGFVHVADRHIAPGKKQWTWGDSPFGHAWERLLTDDDGPYIELMAGAYTDNQPDFAWLEPGETKAFTQTWYPIHRIGPVHQANLDAAVHLDVGDDIGLGVCVPAERPGARIVVTAAGRTVLDETVDLAPGRPFTARFGADGVEASQVEVMVECGGIELIRWRPRPEAPAEEPWVAAEPPAPADVGAADELYLTGVHLQQYRHPTRSPLPYWREALRRDPDDARSNLALAADAYGRADYEEAEAHANRALRRLTERNANPRDGETSYVLGLVLARAGRKSEALDAFAKAAWDVRWLGPASLELARLDARGGRWSEALAHAETAAHTRPGDSRAHALRVVALRALGRGDEAAAELSARLATDPLDQIALALAGRPGSSDPRTMLDVARELAAAGDTEGALSALDRLLAVPPNASGDVRPLALYERAMLCDRLGRTDDAVLARQTARATDGRRCFPFGLDDHDALRAALDADADDVRAAALLALLLFDQGRSEDALSLWTDAIARGLRDPIAFRTAAIAVYNTRGDAAQALDWYAQALALDPCARLLFERDQLLARVDATALERLEPLDRQRTEALRRDDLTVEYCRLLAHVGRAAEALTVMESRRFAPWEGGEGQSVAAWEEVLCALSDEARDRGDLATAADFARRAIELPESLGEQRHPLTDTTALHERLASLLDGLGQHRLAAQTRAAAVSSATGPVVATQPDGELDYFATSLPDQLLFSRRPGDRKV